MVVYRIRTIFKDESINVSDEIFVTRKLAEKKLINLERQWFENFEIIPIHLKKVDYIDKEVFFVVKDLNSDKFDLYKNIKNALKVLNGEKELIYVKIPLLN